MVLKQLAAKWLPSSRPIETKSQIPATLIDLNDLLPATMETRTGYNHLASSGFSKNPVVYRCIRMIAEASANVPWVIYEGDVELDDHPLLDLLAKPNRHQAGSELFENIYCNLMLAGNAYIEAIVIDDKPRELYSLRPDRIKINVDNNGWPKNFEYTVDNNKRLIAIDSKGIRRINHLLLYNPTDDHYGLSPLVAAQSSLDIHNSANKWNKALLDNSARPSGALVYNSDNDNYLSEEQFERLKRELEDTFQGAVNAGRPLLLEGGLDWKAMALSPRDMDFIAAKNAAAREIALAFGIPPMLLGIPGDNTYTNFQEANRALWRQTILPLVAKTANSLTNWLGSINNQNIRIWYDPDAIEALSSERESLWRRIAKASFLSDDEKRVAVGYGKLTNKT